MQKCSVGSTDYVCSFLPPKILRDVEDIDVWNFRQEKVYVTSFRAVK